MRSHKSINRKKIKARLRRKDYTKKINIKRNNLPILREEIVSPILSPSLIDGKMEFKNKKAVYKTVGEKVIKVKLKGLILHQGDGILPKSRKFKEKKSKFKK